MATLNLPASTVRDSEQALVELYRDRLARIAEDADSALGQRAANLDARFAHDGFSDLLCDEVERLAAEHRATRTGRADWLLEADEAQRLRQRALEHLDTTLRSVRHLGEQLAQADAGSERLRLGEALHRQLGAHRLAYRRVLDVVGPDAPAIGTGTLTAEVVDRNLLAIEQTLTDVVGEPTTVRTELASIDLERLAARTRTGVQSVESQERELVAERAPETPIDPGLTELLRARLDARHSEPERPTVAPRLAELDAALERASRQYGAAYAVSNALGRLAPPSNAFSQEVAELAVLRANLFGQRLAVSSHVSGDDAERMRQQHAALEAEAERLSALAAAGRPVSPGALDDLARGLAEDATAAARAANLPAALAANLQETAQAAAARLHGLSAETTLAPDEAALRRQAAADLRQARADMQRVAGERLHGDTDTDRDALSARVQRDIDQGAQVEGQDRFAAIATDRLLARSRATSYASLMPSFGVAHVLVREATDVSPMGADATDQRAYAPAAGLAATEGARRLALGSDVGTPVATEVQQRADRAATPPGGLDALQRGLAQMGAEVARSLTSLSGLFEAGLRSTRPLATEQAAAPRMAARMPSNIFADTSGDLMQQVYLPALSRMAGVRTHGPDRKAPQATSHGARLDHLASPEALLHAMLGDTSQRLATEHPDVAARVHAQVEKIAAMMPNAGSAGRDLLSRYSARMRHSVDAWLTDGSPGFVAHDAGSTPLGGAAGPVTRTRTSPDARAAQAATETSLRGERLLIHPSIIRRIESLLGRSMSGVEAFAGQTAGEIAREMGARGFTVGRKMFFDPSALNLNAASGEGLLAHELTHAALGNMGGGRGEIAAEERLAYGVQAEVERSTASTIEGRIAAAFEKMEIARELPTGSSQATMLAQPAVRAAAADSAAADSASDSASGSEKSGDKAAETDPFKNADLFEDIFNIVQDLIRDELSMENERRGRG